MPGGYPTIIVSTGLPTIRALTTTGIPTGSSAITGDYSTTAQDFYYTTTDIAFNVSTILLHIADNAKFNLLDYGSIPGGVTNGLKFFLYDVKLAAEIPLMTGISFKTNRDFFLVTQDTELTSFDGTSQVLTVNFNLERDFGIPLHMNAGDKLILRANDNFSTLVSQSMHIRGIKY
jgi:hypothetical protein